MDVIAKLLSQPKHVVVSWEANPTASSGADVSSGAAVAAGSDVDAVGSSGAAVAAGSDVEAVGSSGAGVAENDAADSFEGRSGSNMAEPLDTGLAEPIQIARAT